MAAKPPRPPRPPKPAAPKPMPTSTAPPRPPGRRSVAYLTKPKPPTP